MLEMHGARDQSSDRKFGAYKRRQPLRMQVLFMDRIRQLFPATAAVPVRQLLCAIPCGAACAGRLLFKDATPRIGVCCSGGEGTMRAMIWWRQGIAHES